MSTLCTRPINKRDLISTTSITNDLKISQRKSVFRFHFLRDRDKYVLCPNFLFLNINQEFVCLLIDAGMNKMIYVELSGSQEIENFLFIPE